MLIAEIWRDSASIVCDGRYRKLAAVGNFPGLLGFCFYSYGYCNCFAINRLPHCLIPVRKNNKLVVWRWAFPKHNLPPAFTSRKIEHYGLHGRLRYSPPPICNISSPSKSSTSCHSALTLDLPLCFLKVQTLPSFLLRKKHVTSLQATSLPEGFEEHLSTAPGNWGPNIRCVSLEKHWTTSTVF